MIYSLEEQWLCINDIWSVAINTGSDNTPVDKDVQFIQSRGLDCLSYAVNNPSIAKTYASDITRMALLSVGGTPVSNDAAQMKANIFFTKVLSTFGDKSNAVLASIKTVVSQALDPANADALTGFSPEAVSALNTVFSSTPFVPACGPCFKGDPSTSKCNVCTTKEFTFPLINAPGRPIGEYQCIPCQKTHGRAQPGISPLPVSLPGASMCSDNPEPEQRCEEGVIAAVLVPNGKALVDVIKNLPSEPAIGRVCIVAPALDATNNLIWSLTQATTRQDFCPVGPMFSYICDQWSVSVDQIFKNKGVTTTGPTAMCLKCPGAGGQSGYNADGGFFSCEENSVVGAIPGYSDCGCVIQGGKKG